MERNEKLELKKKKNSFAEIHDIKRWKKKRKNE